MGKVAAGAMSQQDIKALSDRAIRDTIKRFEATGSPIISDGEQRWSSFATYAITDTLAGTGLADHLAGTEASSSRFSPTATIASCPG